MCLSMITSPTTDKPLLITGYENGQLLLWDVMAEKVLTRSLVHSESGFTAILDKQSNHAMNVVHKASLSYFCFASAHFSSLYGCRQRETTNSFRLCGQQTMCVINNF